MPALANRLRAAFPQHEIFDDWYSAGFEADDMWRDYEKGKGHDFQAALRGHAAKHVFQFDKHHLDTCDVAVLVLPAGKSGHLELGYVAGKGKPTAILLDSDPDRFDVMYQFADRVAKTEVELVEWLSKVKTLDPVIAPIAYFPLTPFG